VIIDDEKQKITDALAVANNADLEAAAAFEVPIRNEFSVAKADIIAVHDTWMVQTQELDIDEIIADVADSIKEAQRKVDSFPETDGVEGGDGGDGDDGGDGGDGGDDSDVDGSGNVGEVDPDTDDGDGDGEEGGATSLTTFATIVVASVYTLAF